MYIIYVIISILLILGCRFHRAGSYNDSYISKEQCNCIKGFFIAVVFCRHIVPYIVEAGYDFSIAGDNVFRWIDGHIGQLLVVMFLFYSGYGVTESIKTKGGEYVRRIPKKRILVTLANFDVAVFIFMVVDFLLSIEYSTKDILLSFTGWKSIGNSNWYIFVILVCYLSSFGAYRISSHKEVDRTLFGGVICSTSPVYI